MSKHPEHQRLRDLSLDDIHEEAWARLGRGVVDRKSALRTPIVACLDALGRPSARTVVLRAADPRKPSLTFHTDTRAGKVVGLRRSPWVEWAFYDARHNIQIRARGAASLHQGDAIARAGWQTVHLGSRRTYLAHPAPGTAVSAATSGLTPALAGHIDDPTLVAPGFDNFLVVVCTIEALEWLYLARGGHRRAVLRYTPKGRTADWLVP